MTQELYGLRRFGIKPGLAPMREALAKEGLGRPTFQTILVAGTNGKGTVASMISSILAAHGLRVGLYTSPHLVDVQERFRVQGRPLSPARVEPTLRRVLSTYGQKPEEIRGLTFFEITTLVAAVLFEEEDVDVAVMEIGLGGRLDAVNAMEPNLSVVTTIGFDHTSYLGDEIGQIASEKAGIFRSGVPAVIGGQEEPEAREELLQAGNAIGARCFEVEDRGPEEPPAERHRHTARKSAELFLGGDFSGDVFKTGIERWRWPGRLEELEWGKDTRILMDAAHNPAGVAGLLREIKRSGRKFDAVLWTMMKDKDSDGVRELLVHIDAPVWGGLVANERARDAAALEGVVPAALWQGAAVTKSSMDSISSSKAAEVLVFGSIFLLGEVYQYLGIKACDLVSYRVG